MQSTSSFRISISRDKAHFHSMCFWQLQNDERREDECIDSGGQTSERDDSQLERWLPLRCSPHMHIKGGAIQ